MEMGNLGKRQKEIYEFIKLYFDKHSIPPTVREIAEAVSLKSTSTVHLHLKELQKRGLISMEPMKQRSITIMRSEGSRGVLTPLIGELRRDSPYSHMTTFRKRLRFLALCFTGQMKPRCLC